LAKKKSARWHTVYSIISTVIEEAGIAALFLWLMPLFGIVIPLWVVILVLAGFAVFSYFMYRIGHPTILYEPVNSPESIIGSTGIVERALNPEGYVRVCGELWQASGTEGNIERGEEVIVASIEGLKLTVVRKSRSINGQLH
jgi:membrane protein implicated in regulation of membrane protease activity